MSGIKPIKVVLIDNHPLCVAIAGRRAPLHLSSGIGHCSNRRLKLTLPIASSVVFAPRC